MNKKGSIMIWTALLGMMMASVFLFAATRLNANTELQRKTIEYQNQKAYLESYMNYVKTLDAGQLNSLKTVGIDFEGITGTVTNNAEEITGVLDDGESVDYPITGNVKVEWNKCDESETGVGLIEITPATGTAEGNCGPFEYDGAAFPNPAGTLTLTSTFAPFHYRITPVGGTQLVDNKWTASLSIDLEYRKKITLEENFPPAP